MPSQRINSRPTSIKSKIRLHLFIRSVSTNLNSYQSILKDYISFFAEPTDSKVGGVVMLVKNIYKISERKDLKIPFSSKVRVEDLWVEITNKSAEKNISRVLYRHPRGDVKLFTDQIENLCQRLKMIEP